MTSPRRYWLLALVAGFMGLAPVAADLERELGRNDVRIWSEAYPLSSGRTVAELRLVDRLERLGYERVRETPNKAGQFFFGFDHFRIFRRAFRYEGRELPALQIVLVLDRESGRITGVRDAAGEVKRLKPSAELRLDPELLAESVSEVRAPRVLLDFEELPEIVWRPLLAIEDNRFFDHRGVDGRAVARALLSNVRSKKVSQGGSTLTQQLIKNRDLSPKRTLGRKVSEAFRSLALEAEYTKEEILESYLNTVYLGHADGVGLYGFGAAARVFFSKDADELELHESALLGAIVQGPNGLSPLRNPERARKRRDRVLDRMAELGWASQAEIDSAKRSPIRLKLEPSAPTAGRSFLNWVRAALKQEFPDRLEAGRGFVVETTLDPLLQHEAEQAVRSQLRKLRKSHHKLRRAPLQGVLVAIDPQDGGIRAYVAGDPDRVDDSFDRARTAKRQPGSTIKPLLLLEALESCGPKDALHPATRVSDAALTIGAGSTRWEPKNFDRREHGVVSVREALEQSYNVPFVRIARWCGPSAMAARLRKAGLDLPNSPPLSFSLGAIEATPLQIVRAYSVFAHGGQRVEPFGLRRVERPAGGKLLVHKVRTRKVVSAGSAYLARILMRGVVENGSGQVVKLAERNIAGKTGTSSDLRDAWFAGHEDGLVTVVWVGLDRGALGQTGAAAAGPIWRAFMNVAAPSRPDYQVKRPNRMTRAWIDPQSGLRVREGKRGAIEEWFRKPVLPRRDRVWRRDTPEGLIP